MSFSRRKFNRLSDFDYSRFGYYFVTICTKGKKEWFGEISGGVMILNNIGMIVEKCWKEIPNHFKNVDLDHYVIMPNHIHGIVIIKEEPNCFVGTRHALSLQENRKYHKLPIVIGSFKSAASKLIHQIGINNFLWQRSFYDHIIKNEKSYNQIVQYIFDNPLKWSEDEENIIIINNNQT